MVVDATLDAVAKGLGISGAAVALGALGDTLGGGVGLGTVGRWDLLDIRVSHLARSMYGHGGYEPLHSLCSSHAFFKVRERERYKVRAVTVG